MSKLDQIVKLAKEAGAQISIEITFPTGKAGATSTQTIEKGKKWESREYNGKTYLWVEGGDTFPAQWLDEQGFKFSEKAKFKKYYSLWSKEKRDLLVGVEAGEIKIDSEDSEDSLF